MIQNKLIMEKIMKDVMKAQYESPSMIELHVSHEGVLCQSGNEGLTEVPGEWGW